MFIERRINPTTNAVELWRCEWENPKGRAARKVFLEKVCDEQTAKHDADGDGSTTTTAICWSYGRTLGNIAVMSPELLGRFPSQRGNDAQLPCDFAHAGKFRHGAERMWCRTHQTHWGTKADIASYGQLGEMRCANHQQRMNYVVAPPTINLVEHAEVGIWCSMPAALSTETIKPRPPRIHVHVREKSNEKKTVDCDFEAVSVLYTGGLGLFRNEGITRVNITPPAAFDFVRAIEMKQEMSCIACSHCGYPHLDLGDFARKPHRKHFCGNCGRDSTWSKEPIISTPLMPLHNSFAKTLRYVAPDRVLNLDDYPGARYAVWASTPAIVWTAEREQEFGIHVHVYQGGRRVVDDTFREVILNARPLDRSELVRAMIERCVT